MRRLVAVAIEVGDRNPSMCSTACRHFRPMFEACSLNDMVLMEGLKKKGRGFARTQRCLDAEVSAGDANEKERVQP